MLVACEKRNALALGRSLARHFAENEDIDTALRTYNSEHQPIGNMIVMHGRRLGGSTP